MAAVAALGAGCAATSSDAPPGVRALRYHLRVADSGFALAHGIEQIIDELFLPDHGVACNIEWTTSPSLEEMPLRLRAFAATKERLSNAEGVTEVVLPKDLATAIVAMATQQTALAKQVMATGLLSERPAWAEPRGADGEQ